MCVLSWCGACATPLVVREVTRDCHVFVIVQNKKSIVTTAPTGGWVGEKRWARQSKNNFGFPHFFHQYGVEFWGTESGTGHA